MLAGFDEPLGHGKSHAAHADLAELPLVACRHRQAPLRFCAVLAQRATAAMSQTDATLVGASAMTHYAREAMHNVVENFTADGARDSQLIWRAWRNTYAFIVVGALWEAVAHLGTSFPPSSFRRWKRLQRRSRGAALCQWRSAASRFRHAHPPHRCFSRWPRLLASRRAC